MERNRFILILKDNDGVSEICLNPEILVLCVNMGYDVTFIFINKAQNDCFVNMLESNILKRYHGSSMHRFKTLKYKRFLHIIFPVVSRIKMMAKIFSNLNQ